MKPAKVTSLLELDRLSIEDLVGSDGESTTKNLATRNPSGNARNAAQVDSRRSPVASLGKKPLTGAAPGKDVASVRYVPAENGLVRRAPVARPPQPSSSTIVVTEPPKANLRDARKLVTAQASASAAARAASPPNRASNHVTFASPEEETAAMHARPSAYTFPSSGSSPTAGPSWRRQLSGSSIPETPGAILRPRGPLSPESLAVLDHRADGLASLEKRLEHELGDLDGALEQVLRARHLLEAASPSILSPAGSAGSSAASSAGPRGGYGSPEKSAAGSALLDRSPGSVFSGSADRSPAQQDHDGGGGSNVAAALHRSMAGTTRASPPPALLPTNHMMEFSVTTRSTGGGAVMASTTRRGGSGAAAGFDTIIRGMGLQAESELHAYGLAVTPGPTSAATPATAAMSGRGGRGMRDTFNMTITPGPAAVSAATVDAVSPSRSPQQQQQQRAQFSQHPSPPAPVLNLSMVAPAAASSLSTTAAATYDAGVSSADLNVKPVLHETTATASRRMSRHELDPVHSPAVPRAQSPSKGGQRTRPQPRLAFPDEHLWQQVWHGNRQNTADAADRVQHRHRTGSSSPAQQHRRRGSVTSVHSASTDVGDSASAVAAQVAAADAIKTAASSAVGIRRQRLLRARMQPPVRVVLAQRPASTALGDAPAAPEIAPPRLPLHERRIGNVRGRADTSAAAASSAINDSDAVNERHGTSRGRRDSEVARDAIRPGTVTRRERLTMKKLAASPPPPQKARSKSRTGNQSSASLNQRAVVPFVASFAAGQRQPADAAENVPGLQNSSKLAAALSAPTIASMAAKARRRAGLELQQQQDVARSRLQLQAGSFEAVHDDASNQEVAPTGSSAARTASRQLHTALGRWQMLSYSHGRSANKSKARGRSRSRSPQKSGHQLHDDDGDDAASGSGSSAAVYDSDEGDAGQPLPSRSLDARLLKAYGHDALDGHRRDLREWKARAAVAAIVREAEHQVVPGSASAGSRSSPSKSAAAVAAGSEPQFTLNLSWAWRIVMDSYINRMPAQRVKHITNLGRVFVAWRAAARKRRSLMLRFAQLRLARAVDTSRQCTLAWFNLTIAASHHKRLLARTAFRVLAAYAQYSKRKRLQQRVAVEYQTARLAMKVMRDWRLWTEANAPSRRLRAIARQHALATLAKPALMRWLGAVAERRIGRDVAGAALLTWQRNLCKKAFAAWHDRVILWRYKRQQKRLADMVVIRKVWSEWRAARLVEKRNVAARTHAALVLARNVFSEWRLQAMYQKSMKQRIAAMTQWRHQQSLARAVATWYYHHRSVARTTALAVTAAAFRDVHSAQRALRVWAAWAQESAMEKTASAHAVVTAKRRVLFMWGHHMLRRQESKAVLHAARQFRRSRVMREIMAAWKAWSAKRVRKNALKQHAIGLHAILVARRAVAGIRQYCDRVAMLEAAADAFRQQCDLRLVRSIWHGWHGATFRVELFARRVELNVCRSVLAAWRDEALPVLRVKSRKRAIADRHYALNLLGSTFAAWDEHARRRNAKRQMLASLDDEARRNAVLRAISALRANADNRLRSRNNSLLASAFHTDMLMRKALAGLALGARVCKAERQHSEAAEAAARQRVGLPPRPKAASRAGSSVAPGAVEVHSTPALPAGHETLLLVARALQQRQDGSDPSSALRHEYDLHATSVDAEGHADGAQVVDSLNVSDDQDQEPQPQPYRYPSLPASAATSGRSSPELAGNAIGSSSSALSVLVPLPGDSNPGHHAPLVGPGLDLASLSTATQQRQQPAIMSRRAALQRGGHGLPASSRQTMSASASQRSSSSSSSSGVQVAKSRSQDAWAQVYDTRQQRQPSSGLPLLPTAPSTASHFTAKAANRQTEGLQLADLRR